MDLLVTIKEIHGRCPVYQVGDEFVLKEGYQLDSARPVCMHGLAALMPFYNALRVADPSVFGLTRKDAQDSGKAYLQCLDPCMITGGGTVIFEVSRIEAT